MFNRFQPHDLIALVLIAAALMLRRTGDAVMAPMLLSTIVGFYFGAKAGAIASS